MSDARVVFDTSLDESGLKRGLSRLSTTVGGAAKAMGWAIGAVATGLGALAKQGMSYNSSMEQYATSFSVLLGSTEAAQRKVLELKDFAAKTPFEMTDLADATKTILGFGVAENKASVAMKQLGDISMGNSEKFRGLSLVYGQVSSTGKLMGQDLLQMINQGFNPLTIIADKTGAAVGDLKAVMAGERTSSQFKALLKSAQAEVKKLGENASPAAKMLAQIGKEGVISADMVDQAMKIATSSGGLFYDAMNKQSQTAAGMMSTLKDNLNTLGGDAFMSLTNAAKEEAIPAALGYVEQLSTSLREGGTKGLVSAFGDVLGSIVGRGAESSPQVINMAVGLIKSLVGGLKKNAPTIAKGIAETLKAASVGMIQAAPDMINVLVEVATEIVSGLAAALPDIIPELVDAFFSIVTSLLADIPKLYMLGVKIAAALVKGLVGGFARLIGSFVDIFDAIFNGTRIDAQEVQDYVDDKCSRFAQSYEDTKTKIEELRTSIDDGVALTDADFTSAQLLLDTLDEMGTPKDLSASELAQYKEIVAAIAEKWPGLEKYIGKDGLFKQDTDAIREHMAALYAERQAEYLLDKVPAATEAAGQAQKDYNDRIAAIRAETAALAELKAQHDVIVSAQAAANAALYGGISDDAQLQKVRDLVAAYEEAGGSLSTLTEGAFSSIDQVTSIDSVNFVLSSLANAYDTASADIATDVAAVETAISALTAGGEYNGTDIPSLAAVRDQATAAQTIVNDLKTEIEELIAPATETSPEKVVRAMKDKVETKIEDTGAALDTGKTTLKEKAEAVRDEIMAGLAGDGTETADVGTGIVDEVAGGIKTNDKVKTSLGKKTAEAVSAARTFGTNQGYSIGTNTVAGIVQGINDHGYRINVALSAALSVALLSVMRLLGIRSPSTVMRDKVGKNMALGVGVGFADTMDGLSATLGKALTESAQNGLKTLNNTMLAKALNMTGLTAGMPSISSVSASALKGSTLSGLYGGTTVGGTVTTVEYKQTVNFNQPIQAPDEVARAMRRVGSYGLAGART